MALHKQLFRWLPIKYLICLKILLLSWLYRLCAKVVKKCHFGFWNSKIELKRHSSHAAVHRLHWFNWPCRRLNCFPENMPYTVTTSIWARPIHKDNFLWHLTALSKRFWWMPVSVTFMFLYNLNTYYTVPN